MMMKVLGNCRTSPSQKAMELMGEFTQNMNFRVCVQDTAVLEKSMHSDFKTIKTNHTSYARSTQPTCLFSRRCAA